MYVCTKSFLKTTTNSLCVCAHVANKAMILILIVDRLKSAHGDLDRPMVLAAAPRRGHPATNKQ